MEFLKAKIDTINLNFKIVADMGIVHKKNYKVIELFPRLQNIFRTLQISEDKFKLHNNSVASKYKLNFEGVYLEFKSMPPRTGEVINHEKKLCFLQFKGEWFLKNSFEKFIEIYNELNPDSISKIEVAFDFIEEDDFLKDTMNIFLNHRNCITDLGGENKIQFHLNSEEEHGLSYSNISKEIKIYKKSTQLKKNKMKDLFYEKNPEYLNRPHFRIELGLARSVYIDKNLELATLLHSKKSELDIIKSFVNVFFNNFEVTRKSKLKKIIKTIQQ
jgi:hypothetical protein